MKIKLVNKILAIVFSIALVLSLASCAGTTGPSESNGETVLDPNASPDVPSNRYNAVDTPRTGSNADKPLVLSTGTLDGKFNPFFYTSAYDGDVVGMTSLGLLYYNKDGAPEAGVDAPCLAYDFKQEVASDNSTSTYTFYLKNGVNFSDGERVSAKDVLFSLYVLSDPMYDGSSTFYTLKIQGLPEYRLQTSADVLTQVDKILAAGITDAEDGSMAINPADGITAEQQEAFWSYFDEAGEMFAQDIIDYVNAKYPAYIPSYFGAFTADEVAGNANLQAAFGMVMWGFAGLDDDGVLTDDMDNTYNLPEDTVDAKIYWENILNAYGHDLDPDEGINAEIAGDAMLEDYVKDLYITNEGQLEGGVSSISGVSSGVEEIDGVNREYVKIVLNGVDPTAIFKLGFTVAPFHYYTDGYSGTLNDVGVDLGSKAFMDHIKTKNDKPLGAGPYIFEEFKDKVVTFTANDDFLLGSPKIKTFRYQEISLGAELDAVKTGTVHYADPSASLEIVNDITAGSGDYAKMAYTLVDNDGYGYIGIQGQAIPEFEVRKALAHAMNVQLSVDNWYHELASVNYRTMTKVLWAYPDNPANLFPFDDTGETSKALFLEAGYIYEDDVMKYPADHEKAGQQATFKFTVPSDVDDHPAGSIFLEAQDVLAKIGVKVDIEKDENLLNKLNTAYDSGVEVFCAAWGGGGVDPDMFQIWYSDPKVNQGPPRAGLYYLYENGSDEEKDMLTRLNELIDAGRSTLDVEERKEIYKEALELSTGIAVEIPTYQRKNMYVYDKEVIDSNTLFSGEDVTPFQSPLSFIWNVELLG